MAAKWAEQARAGSERYDRLASEWQIIGGGDHAHFESIARRGCNSCIGFSCAPGPSRGTSRAAGRDLASAPRDPDLRALHIAVHLRWAQVQSARDIPVS